MNVYVQVKQRKYELLSQQAVVAGEFCHGTTGNSTGPNTYTAIDSFGGGKDTSLRFAVFVHFLGEIQPLVFLFLTGLIDLIVAFD